MDTQRVPGACSMSHSQQRHAEHRRTLPWHTLAMFRPCSCKFTLGQVTASMQTSTSPLASHASKTKQDN